MKLIKKDKEIAILGSGICGLHLALSFVEQGFQVSVFSSQQEIPASLASHGVICHKGYTLPRDKAFYDKLEGARLLKKRIGFLEEKTGVAIPRNGGVYEVFQSPPEEQRLRSRIYHRQFTGCFKTEFLRGKKLRNEGVPWGKLFEKEPLSAYSYPEAFSFDALAYLKALKKYLEMRGVLFFNAKIGSLELSQRGYFLLAEGQKKEFRSVLCALGSKTQEFLEPLGLDLEPMKLSEGFTLRFSFKEKFNPFAALVSQKNFNCLSSGLTVGSYLPAQLESACLDKVCLNKVCVDKMCLSKFSRFFPGFSDDFFSHLSEPFSVFYGSRAFTRSRAPYLGHFQRKNGSKLIVLSGMYKSGFSLAEIYSERALSFF